MSVTRTLWGSGLSTVASDGTVLDAWFPEMGLEENGSEAGSDVCADPDAGARPDAAARSDAAAEPDAGAEPDADARSVPGSGRTADSGPGDGTRSDAGARSDDWRRFAGADDRRAVVLVPIEVRIDPDQPVTSTADAYLRLHALSRLLVRPNGLELDGIFAHLPTVAWTNAGPVLPADVDRLRPALQRHGIQVQGLDKFPRLTDYVQPEGVRIADAARVRLGAHLSPGTTVMHEGFVNFNAGTLGPAMVEGRVSQGVVVGAHSDIGGGASIMGTLSGGGAHRVSIGARTLLGANAGVGISLGDDCVVEAGLYVTAGTKVALVGAAPRPDGGAVIVKAAELSGRDGLLFRRDSVTGAVQAVTRIGAGVTLNESLHA